MSKIYLFPKFYEDLSTRQVAKSATRPGEAITRNDLREVGYRVAIALTENTLMTIFYSPEIGVEKLSTKY